MILLFRSDRSEAQLAGVLERLEPLSTRVPDVVRANGSIVIRLTGFQEVDHPEIEAVRREDGFRAVIPDDPAFVLSSRPVHPEDTRVEVAGGVTIGGEALVLAAGPCSVEDRDQLRRAAAAAREGGARLLRGGAYKPRTSRYSFQGLQEPGLELLREVADEFELAVVTEVMTPSQVELVAAHADMLQIGSRNVQNFALLQEVGRQSKPVLLKRGMMSEVDEFLGAADYVMAEGNHQVVLCERGIRTFEPRMRNTFDVAVIPLLKELSHLPVIADPSHATGRASLVAPTGRAAIAAGADGLLVEVHPEPAVARCDGAQALLPEEFVALASQVRGLAPLVGRSF